MLKLYHQLYFPVLKYEGSVKFNRPIKTNAKNKETTIFSLDWFKKESITRQKHEKWLQKTHLDKNISFIEDLPQKWDDYVRTRVYAIPAHYLDKIREESWKGLTEWNNSHINSFDTMIKEICLIPALAHIKVVFKLLADCVFDGSISNWENGNRYYSRSLEDNYLLSHLLIYKFWSHQTGRGLLYFNADIEKIEQQKERLKKGIDGQNNSVEVIKVLDDFLTDLEKHEQKKDRAYKSIL
jgi:hypothetical protein